MRRLAVAIVAFVLFGPACAGHYFPLPRGTGENAVGFTSVLIAQEGHPLTGTWAGDWWTAAGERTHVTMVMNWDGKAITGLINPGPDQAALSSVALDPAAWSVRIEADVKMANGQPAHVTADGKLEDLASYHRTLSGTWTQGTTKGTFKLTRD